MSARMALTACGVSLVALLSGCDGCKGGGSFDPEEIITTTSGDFMELKDERLTFVDSSGNKWVAPKGTLTDGASVPRLALPITDGRFQKEFLKAAAVHDAYCQEINEHRTPEQYRKKPWKSVHRMFYEASLAGGTDPLLAKIMFAGVWLGGPRWNDTKSTLQHVSDEVLLRAYLGSKDWIERTDPSVESLESMLSDREPLIVDLHDLEVGIQGAIEANDAARAESLLNEEQELLKGELAKAPDDLMLLNFKGHYHKHRADLLLKTGTKAQSDAELMLSEQKFKAIVARQPKNPSALSGLSEVSVARRDLVRAAELSAEALRIAPRYEPAERELERIERLRREPPN